MPPTRLASRFWVPLLLATSQGLFAGQSFVRIAESENVNQQYLIESVSIAGVDLHEFPDAKLPAGIRSKLFALIGQHCDLALLDDLSGEIRKQLHLRDVTERLSRGSAPDQIRVDFQLERKDAGFDVSLPRFLYHSQQGFTGEIDASAQLYQNVFTLALVSNGDDMTERFSGIAARFESAGFASNRIHLITKFEDYHELWNGATVAADRTAGLELYRSRRNIAPEVSFEAAPGLTVAAGVSLEQLGSEDPADRTSYANAATLDVRYRRKIEKGAIQQVVEGRYTLRVATHALGSTYTYARHLIAMQYEVKNGRNVFSNTIMAGSITGQPPFFERFVLGSSSTLRGWNRYAIDPLGGNRVIHDEITYGYQVGERKTVQTFYDTGVLWNSDTGPVDRAEHVRHSVGVGYRQGVFTMAVAFPLAKGHIEPVFMAGMNY